jgi:hypothetical protein
METSMYLSPQASKLPEPARQELTDFLESLLKKYQVEKPPHPYFGCMKGTVLWMSDDFNEPLEDFKDYM